MFGVLRIGFEAEYMLAHMKTRRAFEGSVPGLLRNGLL
jgi:hypothetical protein